VCQMQIANGRSEHDDIAGRLRVFKDELHSGVGESYRKRSVRQKLRHGNGKAFRINWRLRVVDIKSESGELTQIRDPSFVSNRF
jgi:hypothetical protein